MERRGRLLTLSPSSRPVARLFRKSRRGPLPTHSMVPTSRHDSLLRAVRIALLSAACCCSRSPPDLDDQTAVSNTRPEPTDTDVSGDPSPRDWVVAHGRMAFLLRGVEPQTIRGDTRRASGRWSVDVSDLTKTRGSIELDLDALETTSFEDVTADRAQTLEVRRRFAQLREDDTHPSAARWSIRSVSKATPQSLSGRKATQRTARLHVEAELSLNGQRTRHHTELELTVAFSGDVAQSFHLRTVEDLVVPLDALQLSTSAHNMPPEPRARVAEMSIEAAARALHDENDLR